MTKLLNESPSGGSIVYEDDDIIEVPAVIMKEGVFTGLDGEPRLKKFEEFQESAKWLNGVPILPNHVLGPVTSKDRRLGQIVTTRARPEKRDVYGLARFYKAALTPDELTKVKGGQPFDGSIGYDATIEKLENAATWEPQGRPYTAIERGPYHFYEFAIVNQGAATPQDGVGFLLNSAPDHSHNPASAGDEGINMTEGNAPAQPDIKKLLNEALEPVLARMDALEKSTKLLNEGYDGMRKAQEAQTEEVSKGNFRKLLNAAAALELEKIWPEAKTDVLGWTAKNPDKLLNAAKEHDMEGKLLNGGADGFDLAAEQRKLFEVD